MSKLRVTLGKNPQVAIKALFAYARASSDDFWIGSLDTSSLSTGILEITGEVEGLATSLRQAGVKVRVLLGDTATSGG